MAKSAAESVVLFRVRYSETDQMGTYSSARALEWFEVGRTELTRELGFSYAQMEERGVLLPVVEAHVRYLGRARYDDLLKMTTTALMCGKARVRFDVHIVQAQTGASVAGGYTIHAFTDPSCKPIRPPAWFLQALRGGAGE
jgi:acyl-CoA thioester hydrolase